MTTKKSREQILEMVITKKILKTNMKNIEIRVPQNTKAEFEPQIIPKHSRKVIPTIHDAILSIYTKGMAK